ncbi:non-homologous end-joining factor 1 isoform X2 [Carettochelys insculpta]|uniref:non-homologous end-joining factor 1 isoform X2 n=1 Tax=Carettochelys insculpta TaxID=44489 RepID=UPI003EB7F222
MEGSENLESSLLTQPWASVCFGESTFIAKACFRDTGYVLLVSDLSSVWCERAEIDVVGKRSKELNKRLTAHASSFLNRLSNLMCPLLEGRESDATSFSCQQTPSKLTIHVKSDLSGLPFYWDFHCSAAAVEMISRHLLRPLIRMSLALRCQLQELASLLVQKDAEIEDYRESGAALSRGRLRTEPFQEESFLKKFVDERLPQLCGAGDGQAFTDTLQPLYTAVARQEARAVQKRPHSGDAESPELASSHQLAGEDSLNVQHSQQEKVEPPSDLSQSLGATATPSSPAQRARVPVSKSKRKKAKGLFG